MKTPKLTAKTAAREHKNRVRSFSLSHPLTGSNFSLEQIRGWEPTLISQHRAATYALENLLPIEEGSRDSLESRVTGISELLAALKPRKHRYPILSVEPLTWRDEQGYPKLVLMPLFDSGEMEIYAQNGTYAGWFYEPLQGSGHYNEVREKIIGPCYWDVGKRLRAMCDSTRTVGSLTRVSIKMELGKLLIPPSTHEKISKAREFFGEQLFLIAEAGPWVENTVITPEPDPLVVGYEDGLLFLIDVFDLKPIEALATEFAVSPRQPALPDHN